MRAVLAVAVLLAACGGQEGDPDVIDAIQAEDRCYVLAVGAVAHEQSDAEHADAYLEATLERRADLGCDD